MRKCEKYLFELLCELIIEEKKKKKVRIRLFVTSVLYILSRAAFLIGLIIYNITRLSLTCLDKDIYFYINVFFLCTYFLLT